MKTVICDLYKPNGKWYGSHDFEVDPTKINLFDEAWILSECNQAYHNVETYIIRVAWGHSSYLIFPK